LQASVREVLPALLSLSFGVFAIATEGFMIAGLLPDIAADLSVSISLAGQLISVFSLAYALSSPIFGALTAAVERKNLLMIAIAIFAIGNICAARSTDYQALSVSRVLLAFSAGVYMPAAQSFAAQLVSENMRGRALACVNMGATLGITLGVSSATLLGHTTGWRLTFTSLSVLSLAALVALLICLPRIPTPVFSNQFRARFATALKFETLLILVATTLWSAGAYTLFTFVAPLIVELAKIPAEFLYLVLLALGVASILGAYLGGEATDKWGPPRVGLVSLALLGVGYASISLIGYAHPSKTIVAGSVLTILLLCCVAIWAFYASQQVRLLRLTSPTTAPFALSLNASFMYAGFAAGAALGALTLTKGSLLDLGWVGSVCEVIAGVALYTFARSRATLPQKSSGEGRVLEHSV
jgi:predicted MFS family arabinose efflux permease